MKSDNIYASIGLIVFVMIFVGIVSWVWNGIKLTSCDFESDYKCEAIHGIGLFVPPASIITVWFADDEA